MKFLLILAGAATLFAQDRDETVHRFDTTAARAAAYERSLDSIEWRLNQDGMTLHPETVALRARIDAALDTARHEIDAGRLTAAERALTTAEALTDRLAKKLGG